MRKGDARRWRRESPTSGVSSAVPDVAISLDRNLRSGGTLTQLLPGRVIVVTCAGEHDGRMAATHLSPRNVVRGIGLLSDGHVQNDGRAVRVAANMEFVCGATSRASKTLSMSPPFCGPPPHARYWQGATSLTPSHTVVFSRVPRVPTPIQELHGIHVAALMSRAKNDTASAVTAAVERLAVASNPKSEVRP